MSDEAARHDIVTSRVMERLSGFIQGIAISAQEARQIVDRAVAEDSSAPENEIEAKARAWMLISLA